MGVSKFAGHSGGLQFESQLILEHILHPPIWPIVKTDKGRTEKISLGCFSTRWCQIDCKM